MVALTGRRSTAGAQKLLDALQKRGISKRPPLLQGDSAPGRSSIRVRPSRGVDGGWDAGPLWEEHRGYCALDGSTVPEGSFLLRVRGDSMIGDHIQNGDLILVRPQPRTEDGAIGVAMVDGEATVKRLCRTGEGIHLVSSHPAMEPLSIRQDAQLRIIGKVVAVLRFLEPAFSLAPAPGMHAES